MRISFAVAVMGVAVAATSGAANAQTLAERTATAAQVPWYERFTYSTGAATAPPSWSSVNPRDPGLSAANQPQASARWGMTVNVGEEDRLRYSSTVMPREQASIGAYYRFSPRVRVGGQVSVTPQTVTPGAQRTENAQENAGVKLESAFRF